MTRPVAKLLTIAELGELLGWGYQKTWRRIKGIHSVRPGSWLVRERLTPDDVKPGYRINLSLLRKEHPELFEAPDPEDTDGKLEELGERVKVLEMRDRAKGAAIIDLRADMRDQKATYERALAVAEAERAKTEAERAAMRKAVEAARKIKPHRAPFVHEIRPFRDAIEAVDTIVRNG